MNSSNASLSELLEAIRQVNGAKTEKTATVVEDGAGSVQATPVAGKQPQIAASTAAVQAMMAKKRGAAAAGQTGVTMSTINQDPATAAEMAKDQLMNAAGAQLQATHEADPASQLNTSQIPAAGSKEASSRGKAFGLLRALYDEMSKTAGAKNDDVLQKLATDYHCLGQIMAHGFIDELKRLNGK